MTNLRGTQSPLWVVKLRQRGQVCDQSDSPSKADLRSRWMSPTNAPAIWSRWFPSSSALLRFSRPRSQSRTRGRCCLADSRQGAATSFGASFGSQNCITCLCHECVHNPGSKVLIHWIFWLFSSSGRFLVLQPLQPLGASISPPTSVRSGPRSAGCRPRRDSGRSAPR